MRYYILSFLVLFFGQRLLAQPSAVKNAGKAVFTLTTFKADGSLLGSSHGVFIDNEGHGVSDWTPFAGADHAVVVDASGKKMDVVSITGANDLYDIVLFEVAGKTTGATPANGQVTKGNKVWLMNYGKGGGTPLEMTVESVEKFADKYFYYILSGDAPDNAVSCPFINSNGMVIGLMQRATTTNAIHATDVRFAADFKPTGLTVSDPLLRKTSIPVTLPKDKDQALLSMMLSAQQNDSARYMKTVALFTRHFPNATEGYAAQAQAESAKGDYAAAARIMESCIKNATDKSEAHYEYARLIYHKEVYHADAPYAEWNLDKAMEEAQEAYRIKPMPLYQHLQAQITFMQGNHQQAYDQFMTLTGTDLRNPELYYEAAQCKQQLQAPQEEILALLDSAVANCREPLGPESAPYFLARGTALDQAGQYRKAVADYNQYDSLYVGLLSAEFFYQREQCEVKARMYQQALDDIARAVYMSQGDPMLIAEMASLQIRLNLNDDALKTSELCIKIAPEYDEGYLLNGLALIQSGKKKEGLEALQKAKDMGNEQAGELIEKYKH